MKYLLTGQETQRLKFRLLQKDYFDTWMELFKDPNAIRFLGMSDLKTPRERCQRWFSFCEERYANDRGGMNVLIDKSTNELIGQCGLLIQEVDGIKELEIGYSLLPKYRGKGYAIEAAMKCRDFAFSQSLADSIISIIHIENKSSEAVAIKNGMKKSKQTLYKETPVNIYRIHRVDWLKE